MSLPVLPAGLGTCQILSKYAQNGGKQGVIRAVHSLSRSLLFLPLSYIYFVNPHFSPETEVPVHC